MPGRQRAASANTTAFGRVGHAELPPDASEEVVTASENPGRKPRRTGRPRGPERVPLTVRILKRTDERLTAAVEASGANPQYIVDAALAEYLDRLEARQRP